MTIITRKKVPFRGWAHGFASRADKWRGLVRLKPPRIIPNSTRGGRGVGRCVAFLFFGTFEYEK
jgi:hypothetical protein